MNQTHFASGVSQYGLAVNEINRASVDLHSGDLDSSLALALQVESRLSTIVDPIHVELLRGMTGGVFIDIGAARRNLEIVTQGTDLTEQVIASGVNEASGPWIFYNAGNGHAVTWKLRYPAATVSGEVSNHLIVARERYAQALAMLGDEDLDFQCEILIEMGNAYDSVSRHFEALRYYEMALTHKPLWGIALGQKAITLIALATIVPRYHHHFLVEARSFFERALSVELPEYMRDDFSTRLAQLVAHIEMHDQFDLEELPGSPPTSKFEIFMKDFCLRNDLYLTPRSAFDGHSDSLAVDDLYLDSMSASLGHFEKFERCHLFLNEIKEAYIAARHLLLLSQFPSKTTESADKGVEIYLTLDYAAYGTYVQLLKLAYKSAIDVLDKIAYFVRDYFGVGVGVRATDFSTVWADKKTPQLLRPELARLGNPYILALFDLALEAKHQGFLGVLYETRHTLTHRVIVLHEWTVPPVSPEGVDRRTIDSFGNECIRGFQLVRSAILYLVFSLTIEETRAMDHATEEISAPILGRVVDPAFRWRPPST